MQKRPSQFILIGVLRTTVNVEVDPRQRTLF
jgi:hypothetical protein